MECNKDECRSHNWLAADWTPCTKECDGGTQSRKVTCIELSTGEKAADIQCTDKPESFRTCNTKPCERYSWEVSENEWGSCSKICDLGETTRPLRCISADGNVVPNSKCTSDLSAGDPPRTSKPCNPQPCAAFNWMS